MSAHPQATISWDFGSTVERRRKLYKVPTGLDVAGTAEPANIVVLDEWRALSRDERMTTPDNPDASRPVTAYRFADELAWVTANAKSLEEYPGEWVAFASGRLLAHDPSLEVVLERARAQGIDEPFLLSVPLSR